MRYAVIDFETANPRLSSICQIGLATFEKRECVRSRSWLVQPSDYFDSVNVSIHGISEHMVANSPSFAECWPEVLDEIADRPTIHHTHFDRSAASQTCAKYEIEFVSDRWLDSAKIVRRVWPQYASSGFGLANLSHDFEVAFKHHDAAEDARATGVILALALGHSDTIIEDWYDRLKSRDKSSDWRHSHTIQSEVDGYLSGETCVFTGTLTLTRAEAARAAAALGANVAAGVTKHTTIVIVGDQDVARLAGNAKSSKHRKAEELAAAGQQIRIMNEADFKSILEQR